MEILSWVENFLFPNMCAYGDFLSFFLCEGNFGIHFILILFLLILFIYSNWFFKGNTLICIWTKYSRLQMLKVMGCILIFEYVRVISQEQFIYRIIISRENICRRDWLCFSLEIPWSFLILWPITVVTQSSLLRNLHVLKLLNYLFLLVYLWLFFYLTGLF